MKIRRNYIKRQTLQEFAEEHDLTLVINERRDVAEDSPMRLYAKFEDCETKDGAILSSVYGNGSTEAAAALDYVSKISEKLLVFSAMTDKRKEIQVPVLSFEGFDE